MNETLKRKMVLFVYITPLCLVVIGVLIGGLYRRKAVPAPVGLQKERIVQWRSQPFTSLTNDLEAIVSGFTFELSESLGELEKRELTNAAQSFLASYRLGTYDAITRFRIPVTTFHFPDTVSNVLCGRLAVDPGALCKDPMTGWSKYFDTFVKDTYKDYWQGVALPECVIQVERSATPESDLRQNLKYNSVLFVPDSFRLIGRIARRLTHPPENDKISKYIASELSSRTRKLLAEYRTEDEIIMKCQKALTAELNELIQREPLYDPARFTGVKLAPALLARTQSASHGAEMMKVNRALLEAAYPESIRDVSPVANVGLAGRSSVVVLEPTRAEVVAEQGYAKIATMRVVCKPRDNDPVYPVYVRLYWSPKQSKWLPEELVEAYARPDRRFDLIF